METGNGALPEGGTVAIGGSNRAEGLLGSVEKTLEAGGSSVGRAPAPGRPSRTNAAIRPSLDHSSTWLGARPVGSNFLRKLSWKGPEQGQSRHGFSLPQPPNEDGSIRPRSAVCADRNRPCRPVQREQRARHSGASEIARSSSSESVSARRPGTTPCTASMERAVSRSPSASPSTRPSD